MLSLKLAKKHFIGNNLFLQNKQPIFSTPFFWDDFSVPEILSPRDSFFSDSRPGEISLNIPVISPHPECVSLGQGKISAVIHSFL